jgi:hypothetical protein
MISQYDQDGLTIFEREGFWYVLCNADIVLFGREQPSTAQALMVMYRYKALKSIPQRVYS